MYIWKNEQGTTIIATADSYKAFKTSEGYFDKIELKSESEASALVEVYYHNGRELTEDQYTRVVLLHELKEIREWFTSTDYIPNKVIVGEWTPEDPRFVEYRKKRKTMRARQDEIKNALGYGG